jgi:hypothetical protein
MESREELFPVKASSVLREPYSLFPEPKTILLKKRINSKTKNIFIQPPAGERDTPAA